MKVNDTSLASAATTRLGAAERAEGRRLSRKGEANGAETDSVQLSALASRLARMVESESPARVERLERLTALVRSGEYRPNAAAVAASIVEDALVREP